MADMLGYNSLVTEGQINAGANRHPFFWKCMNRNEHLNEAVELKPVGTISTAMIEQLTERRSIFTVTSWRRRPPSGSSDEIRHGNRVGRGPSFLCPVSWYACQMSALTTMLIFSAIFPRWDAVNKAAANSERHKLGINEIFFSWRRRWRANRVVFDFSAPRSPRLSRDSQRVGDLFRGEEYLLLYRRCRASPQNGVQLRDGEAAVMASISRRSRPMDAEMRRSTSISPGGADRD
jgi:hypothetical protein